MTTPYATLDVPQQLADGLLLRLAGPADIDAVADLNERVLIEEDEPPGIFAAWTRDLLSGDHPSTTVSDCVLVEDMATGHLVSSATLIPQVWRYEEIPFGVGRPEMVVTAPDYRRRGLVRAMFEVLHRLSAAHGHQVQAITGIRWFYRQFGYEYGLERTRGRTLPLYDVPDLEAETEPYLTRPATEADVPTIVHLYERHCQDKMMTSLMDEVRWRYDLFGYRPDSAQAIRGYCLTDPGGQIIGYYTLTPHIWNGGLHLWEVSLVEGVSLYTVLPSLLRALKQQGQAIAEERGTAPEKFQAIRFGLGTEHPVYDIIGSQLSPPAPPYAYYLRVADLPGFLGHIAPVLERRLADSVMCGYSGELTLNFYLDGLRLVFEAGRLVEVTSWPPPDTDQDWVGVSFPPLVFLKLLFGYRSLDELFYAYPDCAAADEPALLLRILFPKRVSWVLPLG